MKFQNIYYDYKANKIHHWYRDDDGCNRKEIITPKIEYYIKDKTGQSPIHDIYGTPVILQTTENRFKLKDIKSFTQTYESDSISEEIKFLQKRYKDIDMKADLNDFQIGTIDIESETEKEFKIENIAEYKINLISIHLSKTNQVYTFGIYPYTGKSETVKNYYYIPDEKRMIETFIKFFKKNKVHCLSGWNCSRYDVSHIIKRSEKLGIEVSLSPVGIYREKSGAAGYHVDGGGYEVAGISILDGLDLYKNFEREKRQSYSLDAIGQIEVSEGKIGYEGSINNFWKNDWNKFVEYNVQDVLLTKKINDKKRYIELAINMCYQSLIPFEKVVSSVNLVTGYIMRYLHKNNMVLPDKKIIEEKAELPGAYVMAKTGYFKYCMNFDVESMYPHMIMRYNISPETLVLNPTNTEGLIKTPLDGVYYRKDKVGILATIVSNIFSERKKFKYKYEYCSLLSSGKFNIDNYCTEKGLTKKFVEELIAEVNLEGGDSQYYDSQQYIRKILANSVYGDLSNKHFVFYNYNNAKVITMGGQSLIKFLSNSINECFKNNVNKIMKRCFPEINKEITLENDVVVLLDTDSVDGSSLINTPEGTIKISDLYNMADDLVENHKSKKIKKFNNDKFSLSLNENKELEYKKIKYVMQHKIKKHMYKVKVGEKNVIITEDHSLIVSRNGKLVTCSPKKIEKSDKIIKVIL